MWEHTKVVSAIRTSLLRNQRHWTHILCRNMQRLFEQSRHLYWEIRGTGLTAYVGTCKGCLSNQDISSEKSEALDSQSMLEHANVVWAIRTSFLRNQRHWTHILCWNMQSLLSNQDIFSEKSEALDSHPMWEHANIVWAIRTSLLRNQRHWTHKLCWNMQMLFQQSEYLFWEIRGTGLTTYVGTYKCCLSNEDISSEKSEALDSHPMWEHANIVWAIRTSLLRTQRHWTHILYWNMQMLFEQSEHLSWEIRGTGLTFYVGTCKCCLSNQDIFSEHWTHKLYWNMQMLFEQSGHLFLRTQRHWMNSQAILEDAKVVWVILIRNAISIHIIKCTYLLNICKVNKIL